MISAAARYTLGRLLGSGGNANVYEAFDREANRRVAVKVLASSDAIAAERFRREVRTAMTLRHPNLCETYDAGVLPDGRLFATMELLDGESLRAILLRKGRLDQEEAVEIVVQVLAGLEVAHEAGVLHRDIKPENVFVTRREGRLHIKLLDFGMCRWIDDDVDAASLTFAGFVVGTPGYLAPEQVYGVRDIDARADLFAIGLVLFELLTGRPALVGHTNAERMVAVSMRIPRVSHYRPLNRALDAVISKATEPHVANRYASAAELQHDLLQARTAIRRERSEARARARQAALDSWDVPTRRRVA